jgi:hypothetical protein
LNALLASIARAIVVRRRGRLARVVDEVPLFGGGALHVVDVGGERLVFATSPGAICLLAQSKAVTSAALREEESCTSV